MVLGSLPYISKYIKSRIGHHVKSTSPAAYMVPKYTR